MRDKQTIFLAKNIYDKSPHSSIIEAVVVYLYKTVTIRELQTGCLVSCP